MYRKTERKKDRKIERKEGLDDFDLSWSGDVCVCVCMFTDSGEPEVRRPGQVPARLECVCVCVCVCVCLIWRISFAAQHSGEKKSNLSEPSGRTQRGVEEFSSRRIRTHTHTHTRARRERARAQNTHTDTRNTRYSPLQTLFRIKRH